MQHGLWPETTGRTAQEFIGRGPRASWTLTAKNDLCRLAGRVRASSQSIEILNQRTHRSINALNLWIRRIDQIVLVRSMRAGSVSQPKVSSGKIERFGSEYVPGPGTSRSRPQPRIKT